MIHRSAHLLVLRMAKAQSLKNAFSLQIKQTHLCSLYRPLAYQRYPWALRKGHIIMRGKEISNKHGIMGKQTPFQV